MPTVLILALSACGSVVHSSWPYLQFYGGAPDTVKCNCHSNFISVQFVVVFFVVCLFWWVLFL